MCGFAGYYLWRKEERPDLEKALQLLRHRGPDAARTWEHPTQGIGLAHTRLSILDLSEAAHQPFHRDSLHLAYNGEIYNFRALVQQTGLTPTTRSDTEAILLAYTRWGEKAFSQLEGMFAFALYDEAQETLYLVRDPFGIKPLWASIQPEGVYFASELKVLRAWLPQLSPRPASVAEFLHLGFVPAPHSWYERVYKVLPGEVWKIRPTGVERYTYYDRTQLWQQEVLSDPPESIEERLEEALSAAVRAHLVSDVLVGLFLSGGTDSSLVAVHAARAGLPLRAFSIGFREASHNELPYARAVAEYLGLPLTEALLEPEAALQLIPELPHWFDEPFGDVSALPTYLVSRLAAQQVKVVLAGDGGDELFWGYGRYRWANRIATQRRLWKISGLMLRYAPSARARRVGLLLDLPPTARPEHIFSQEQYTFSWQEVQRLYPSAGSPWQTPYSLPTEAPTAQAAWDFLHYLPDDLLTKVDRASMQHSLEVRVPLLDKRWVELAWRVPSALKKPVPSTPPQYKPLLRRLLKRHLPAALVERKKWGFTVPLAAWLKGPLREWSRTYAAPKHLARRYDLAPKPISTLWKRFDSGESYLATRLWLLAQLGAA